MTAMDRAEDLVYLIRANENVANHADGCSPQLMGQAERQLGLLFPPSYRRLVEEFGTWDIAGVEFPGIYQTPAMGDELLGSPRSTLTAREKWNLPHAMLLVMHHELGDVVLDTSELGDDHEAPVLAWSPGDVTERLGDNFAAYALEVCESAVQSGRNE